ncbi:MAG: hypothetical protein K9J37_21865 [Saprospiraceae bacterium]|nr:hypothetical protein [Saprospiraceae bacterium]MCF8252569.1 hypothetical protein [Saprospiraceae bacterium]MCF8282610.1 hypothetical protein [Bacteroidales bacterium]MCF8314143.1 hypothetical protein [Saprospiraceae bacterium]MCF8442921.1 hypothetical protein [Saprospiraceae bacterium]
MKIKKIAKNHEMVQNLRQKPAKDFFHKHIFKTLGSFSKFINLNLGRNHTHLTLLNKTDTRHQKLDT